MQLSAVNQISSRLAASRLIYGCSHRECPDWQSAGERWETKWRATLKIFFEKVVSGDPRASSPLHCNREFLYESSRKLTGQPGCQPTDLCLCILAPESAKNTKKEDHHALTNSPFWRKTDGNSAIWPKIFCCAARGGR